MLLPLLLLPLLLLLPVLQRDFEAVAVENKGFKFVNELPRWVAAAAARGGVLLGGCWVAAEPPRWVGCC